MPTKSKPIADGNYAALGVQELVLSVTPHGTRLVPKQKQAPIPEAAAKYEAELLKNQAAIRARPGFDLSKVLIWIQ